MNLRGIKIIDLDHSVLDNSVVEGIERSIGELGTKSKSVKSQMSKRRTEVDKLKALKFKSDQTEKESARDKKVSVISEEITKHNADLVAIGNKITELEADKHADEALVEEDQRRGIYRFKTKTYVSYKDAGRRPSWKFMWCHYSDYDNYGMYRDWQVSFGSTAVTINKDRYVPEGVPVNSEGHYVFKDVILMKEDLQMYLRRQITARLRAEGAGRAELDALDSEFASQGANLSDKYKEELFSSGNR